MNQSQGVLLTGATGALGPSLAAELLADGTRTLNVLIRAGAGESADARFAGWLDTVEGCMAESAKSRRAGTGWRRRVRLFCGDVGSENLGLSPAVTDELVQSTDVVIHAAADTGFM